MEVTHWYKIQIMGLLKFSNVGIKAISGTVPKKIVKTSDLTEFFPIEHLNRVIEATGIIERHLADENICASDLCFNAACTIFNNTSISKDDIDVLIFVSQTSDYKTPATSILLQNKLDLKKSTIVYDINMSCSGFIHGLLMAYTFLQLPEIKNVMLLVGDTQSKIISPLDKSTGLLFGDGGIASIITKGKQFGDSYFSMNTDGAHINSNFIPAGGSRMMSSELTLQNMQYDDGSIRNMEQVVMKGMDVFGFVISELPKDIKQLLEFAGKSVDDIDKFAFHQSNNFMSNRVTKKLKVNSLKILRSIQKYGNTGGASIPLTMIENRTLINPGDSILMNAIGAGFVYGSVLINIADCQILEMNEL